MIERVIVLKHVDDMSKPAIKSINGQMVRPQKLVEWQRGNFIGLSTTFEELGYEGNYHVGQYPVMVVALDDGSFDAFPLYLIKRVP